MEFILNESLKYAFIAVIPVLIWFVKNVKTGKEIFFGILFVLVFSQGTLELMGISPTITRLILEILILLLFLRIFVSGVMRYKFPGIFYVFGFIIISVFSYLANNIELINLIIFFRLYLFLIIFLYLILNTNFKNSEFVFLDKLILYLFISQIFANIIKLLILGEISEPYIGTMANQGGSLTTIIALIGGAYCICYYLLTSKKTYLIWLMGFLIFALIGGKRAIIGYFPLIYLLALFYYQKLFFKINSIFLKQLFIALALIGLIFYVTVRTIPTLNPDNTVGGEFDVEYVLNYSEEYTSGGRIEENIGRSEAPAYIISYMLTNNAYNILFGFGAGHLVKSSFNENVVGQNMDDITLTRYGVGYGARTGFLQMLLQIGFLGVIFYFLFFFNLLRGLKKKIVIGYNNIQENAILLTSIIVIYIFFLDYFTYSDTVSIIGAASLSYMWIISIAFRDKKI